MDYNTYHESTSQDFQSIFKTAQAAYKSLPWWKRLFGYDFANFNTVGDVFVTSWRS